MTDANHFQPEAIGRIVRLGGEALVAKMVALFTKNVTQRLEAARTAYENDDLQAVEAAVHSVKSSAGNLGAAHLQRLAELAETKAERAEADGMAQLLDELDAAFAEAQSYMISVTNEK